MNACGLSPGPDSGDTISSMAMDGDAVWVASGPNAIKYARGKEVCSQYNVARHIY